MSNKARETAEHLDFVQADQMVLKHRFRSKYDGRQDEVTALTRSGAQGEVLTKQSFKEESNINHIVNKYLKTGQLPNSSRAAMARFGDFSNIPSYKESLEVVLRAQEMFSELPSAVRNRFRNDPEQILQFLADPANRDEAVKLGLIDASTGKPPAPTQEQSDVSTPVPSPKGKGGVKAPPKPVLEDSDGE